MSITPNQEHPTENTQSLAVLEITNGKSVFYDTQNPTEWIKSDVSYDITEFE